MKIGPRYKKARYLGAPVFKKTQTQKFALRVGTKKPKGGGGRGGRSEYGRQMLEKQKARFSYGVSGKQFSKYVKKALAKEGDNAKNLISLLEGRLDNVVLRAGFAPSRAAARQMVSHGHITVNGTIVTIPSYEVSVGELLAIREGSRAKKVFANLDEEWKTIKWPNWIKVDAAKREVTVEAEPVADMTGLLFDVRAVLEFFTR